MFVIEPPSETPPTIATMTTIEERPLQTETVMEKVSTTTIPIPPAILTKTVPVDMVYVALASIQATAQWLAQTESQLT